jgi:D-alanyl-D-alanine carboxypeptidase/D-alanyl-D-alanine-endopeptidase (penicillin-binding protein 4)
MQTWLGITAQIFLLFLLTGCSSQGLSLKGQLSPELSAGSSPSLALKNEFDGMIARELLPYSVASIKVVSLASGSTLYEMNPALLVQAASLQKLFTAAAALSQLGSNHAIETSIAVNSDENTLYVRGCGDPLLQTGDLAHMVADLAGKLSPGRQYTLVGDTGCFDDAYWGNGWMWDDEPEPEAMFLSALSVNGNTVRVTVSPGTAASSFPEVSTEPSTRYVFIENTAKTGKGERPCTVSITRPAGDRDNDIRVGGSLAPGCPPVSRRLTVWRPELYFLTLLAELLEQSGIKVSSLTLGVTPFNATTLTTVGHPVGEIVSVMLKSSDNLSAENLLKYLAHVKTGQKGTAAGGGKVIKEYLQLHGIPADHMVIADGSGVSRYNLTNAETITRLLVAAYEDRATFPFFVSALPVAGRDGTLALRMKGTPAEGKLRAKTGTMKGVSALAGYTVSADGEPLAFTIIMLNFIDSEQRVRDLQDRMAVLLSTTSIGHQGKGGYLMPGDERRRSDSLTSRKKS